MSQNRVESHAAVVAIGRPPSPPSPPSTVLNPRHTDHSCTRGWNILYLLKASPSPTPWQAVPADDTLIDEALTDNLLLDIVPPRSARGDTTPMTDATTSYSSISTSATTVPVEGMLSHNPEHQSGLAAPHRRPSVRYVRSISLPRLSYQPILSSLFRKPRPQSSSTTFFMTHVVHPLAPVECRICVVDPRVPVAYRPSPILSTSLDLRR